MARLDVELTERGLAASRSMAQRLVAEGRVHVAGRVAERASARVDPSTPITVEAGEDYVSRAAHKLAGALDRLAEAPCGAPVLAGRRVLDAGASTGGFTQVALRRGAAHVVAVDVGAGQLDARLRDRPDVSVLEHTNVRTLDPALVAPAPDVLVADLSFISLTLVLAPLAAALAPTADALLLVKPQFEVGRDRLGSGGVVTDEAARADAVARVLAAGAVEGLRAVAALPSPLAGTHGNHEIVVWLRRDEAGLPLAADAEHRRLGLGAAAGELVVAEWGT